MLNNIIGQKLAISLLKKIIEEKPQGRTFIFLGPQGVGKFTTAINFAHELLNKNPFISNNFIFYRNDNFYLKTLFFTKNLDNEVIYNKFYNYLFYLLGKISISVSLDELPKSISLKNIYNEKENYNINNFRADLEEILLNNKIKNFINNEKFINNLINISIELSKKKKIPIDFIREMIIFNSQKSNYDYKINIIGNFENSTEEAQNSSLKLFEEPSEKTIIILTVSDIKKVLPTIQSRSIIIKFNKLTSNDLKIIFNKDNIDYNYNNTLDFMENEIFQFDITKTQKVIEFFNNVAKKIQYGNYIFNFIGSLTEQEDNTLIYKFLEELIEFFRNLHILRQGYIRNIDLNDFTKKDYFDIINCVIKKTYTSEIKELIKTISTVYGQIKYGNMNPSILLTDLLIKISRWYQKRLEK